MAAPVNFIEVQGYDGTDISEVAKDYAFCKNNPKNRKEILTLIQNSCNITIEDITSEQDIIKGVITFVKID